MGYKKGQWVKVEFEGVVREHDSRIVWVMPEDDKTLIAAIPETAVSVAGPEDWPPQIGDIWQAGTDGREWYARESAMRPRGVVLEPYEYRTDKPGHYPPEKTDSFKDLNPVLVRRRGQ